MAKNTILSIWHISKMENLETVVANLTWNTLAAVLIW